MLEAEIESLKIPPDSSKEVKSEQSLPIKRTNPNMQLLEYIDNKIKAKEKELECPVCFEVASAPIFMCSDLHLICSDCKPKVSICPECREPYPKKAKRHRYAEKAAEDPALKINCGPPTANLWSDWSPQKRVNRDKLDQRQNVRKSRFFINSLLITLL